MKKLSVSLSTTEWILGIVYIFFQLLALPILLGVANILFHLELNEVELNFVCFAINFICVTVIFHKYLIRSAKIAFFQPLNTLKAAGFGLLLYFISSYAMTALIFFIDPEFYNVNDNSIAGMLEQNYVLMSLGAIVLAPVTEEILYRGVVFGRIHHRWPIAAYVISVGFFSALHVIGYIGQYSPVQLLLCFIQYLPPSIILAWTYVKADTIWAPILVHIIINAIGMLAM
jgi:membrane protease YdiL (CAAX protease family)